MNQAGWAPKKLPMRANKYVLFMPGSGLFVILERKLKDIFVLYSGNSYLISQIERCSGAHEYAL